MKKRDQPDLNPNLSWEWRYLINVRKIEVLEMVKVVDCEIKMEKKELS